MSVTARKLEKLLGYEFQDPAILERALTHSSAANEKGDDAQKDNEQMEFLGDSILGFIVSDFLYRRFGHLSEGGLSKLKSYLVSSANLFRVAAGLELGEFLLLGKGEERSGGRKKQALLVNALEALVAAVYMDGGMEKARFLVMALFQQEFDAIQDGRFDLKDFKSQLQEKLQAWRLPPAEYLVVKESGPDHRKLFSVELRFQGRRVASGQGETKKNAEQEAARWALELISREGQWQSLSHLQSADSGPTEGNTGKTES